MSDVKKSLLSLTKKDFEMQTFCTGGPGGQNQNSRMKGVRFIHRPSGAVGEGREFREQSRNKEAAFKRMAESAVFQRWLKIECARLMGAVEPAYGPGKPDVRVRTYNFAYQRVVDHRTGVQSNDVRGVMDGDIDKFIAIRIEEGIDTATLSVA